MNTINLNMTLGAGYNVNIDKREEIVFIGPYAELLFGTITSLDDTMFPSTLTNLRDYLFQNDSGLTTVNLNNITTIGNSTFYACGLTSINMPYLQDAGMQAFAYNPMVSIELPSLTDIRTLVFQGCTSLETADFASANILYQRAFFSCSNLDTLILRNENQVCEWQGTYNLSGTKIEAGEGYIYVPDDLVDSYKEASGWSDFASQIRSIDELEV